VLDIGSGIGRVAIPLTEYLSEEGRYEGFDVVEKGVQWCQTHITRQFPNFQFQYIPLNNDLYRSDGQDATQFSFPYPDDQFDLIVVNSVFTHMLPEEVDNYLGEIRRVLETDWQVLCFLFHSE
jgi:ubiquinone/menaquinone biosynthesis C-methylase UbiE